MLGVVLVLGLMMGFSFWEEVTSWPQSLFVAFLVRFDKILKYCCSRRRSWVGEKYRSLHYCQWQFVHEAKKGVGMLAEACFAAV